jgi:hypothetical protein
MTAWKRTDWNNIITRVNDLCVAPPAETDCVAIAILDQVDPDHIWTKADIQTVRDKLSAICSANTWTEELRLWAQATVDEINAAIAAGWCNCTPDQQCRPDCSNANGSVLTYNGSYEATDCIDCTGGCPPGATASDRATISTQMGIANTKCNAYTSAWINRCVAFDELDALQDELKYLEDALVVDIAARDSACAAGPSEECTLAEQVVANTQDAINAKQAEINAKQIEMNGYDADANDALSEANAAAAACIAAYEAIDTTGIQATYTSFVTAAEWADREYTEVGPWCLGHNPARCRPYYWAIQRKTTTIPRVGSPYTGSWSEVIRGAYTPTGDPYVTSGVAIGASNGVPQYACSAYCASPPCDPVPCWDGCNSTYIYEIRTLIAYPNPVGEECC